MEAVKKEIFDIVNDLDEVIGQRPRSEVHRLGLKHRAVHVLVRNQRGELFLQLRSLSKDREPGKWDSSCSGHVDSGEDYDAAAGRELGEELGWQPEAPPRRLFKLTASEETDWEFVWIYETEGEGPFRLHPEEISGGGWFSPDQIDRWLRERPEELAGAFRLIWKRLRTERTTESRNPGDGGSSRNPP